ncbi:glycoside hydrolase [Clostridium bovifaecis]|uniref:Glycoside hydrolase n=1 Tax=Clostridium bovifaecis TaxID=2184719 RepID=A0A6I6F7Y8_9CLOT|nr:glycoside hydrolase [Clostridium bovifaecis]
MHKKVASVVTTAVLLVTMSTTAVIADPLSDRLKDQETRLQQHRNDYTSAQDKVEAIERQIEHFDEQIETLMAEIEENKTKMKSIQNDIELAQNEIEKAQKEMEEEQELYNERMKTMYMNGVGGYLDVILGADDLSDLVEKIEAVKQLTELDKKIVKELKQKQEDLKVRQENLKKEQDKLEALNKSQQEKIKKLEADKKEQDKLIQEARRQSAAYSDVLKDDQAQISQTKKLIKEAKERLKASSNSNTSSSGSKNNSRPSRGSSADYSSDAVIAYASEFLGTPYVWGANGPETFDCSGFTKYVYAHFGVRLPRVSRDQAEVGTYVEKGDLQPGDLVFFKKGGAPVHHVGIYVGNGSYIHAPRTGDVVKISSLSGRSDYAWARRVR